MKRLQNEQGLTLAEVLAVFVIASIVIILVMNVFLFVQKQYQGQSEDAKQLTDVTIAIKSITRDIRMAEENEIKVEDKHTIKFTEREIEYVWDEDSNILKKDDVNYIYEVENFSVQRFENRIELEITSLRDKSIKTEIVIR